MLNSGGYYPIYSKVHGIHPACKILCFLLFLVMCFTVQSLEAVLAISIFVVILILASNVPLNNYFEMYYRMRYLVVFMILLFLVTSVSWIDGLLSIMKIVWIVGYTSVLFYTTKPLDITAGLESVFGFLNIIHIPVSRIAFSISLAFHFLPILSLQGNKIMASQASRGLDYREVPFWKRFSFLKSMILPMFVLSMKRADYLADVMAVRLYDVDQKRNSYLKKIDMWDIIILLMHILLCIVMLVKR